MWEVYSKCIRCQEKSAFPRKIIAANSCRPARFPALQRIGVELESRLFLRALRLVIFFSRGPKSKQRYLGTTFLGAAPFPFAWDRSRGLSQPILSTFNFGSEDIPITLYFVKSGDRIKMGITSEWERRLSSIRRGNAFDVEVIRIFHSDPETIVELERDLSESLKDANAHNEWYYDCPQVRAAIEELDKRFNPENYAADLVSQ